MNDLVWPHRVLGYKATTNEARKLAKTLIDIFGNDLKNWLKLGRFEIKKEKQISGGVEALCLPMDNNRFRFVIYVNQDDHPMRDNFLIAHEIAHTFFYIRKENQRPQRAIPTNTFKPKAHPWEEDFCDAFAETITGLNYKEVGLSKTKDK